MNKIKIKTPKVSLNNNIGTPPNSPRKFTLTIVDSDKKIHLENEATPTMAPVIMQNIITARLPYVITMESSHVATLQLPGLTQKSKQVHIFLKMRTLPLISLVVICYDGCTITLDRQ